MKKENYILFWVEKYNDLSIGLFAARQEINNLRRFVEIDFTAIEKLIADKKALSDKVCRLEAELRPVEDIPSTSDVNAEINDLLLQSGMYPVKGKL